MSRLPVTIIGGFLGAGKTSLLHSIITDHEGGYLAVLVENPGPLNLDAKAMRGLCGAMRRLQDTVLEVPNLGEEEQLAWVGKALKEITQAGRFERILIEIAGTTNPARLAEHFLTGAALAELAELQQVICVIDALEYFRTGRTDKQPYSLWDFQNEQIAGATLAVLNKCDLLDAKELDVVRKLMHEFNPDVPYVETAYSEVSSEY